MIHPKGVRMKEETKSVVVHLRLTPSQAREMALVAKAEGISPSGLIRRLLSERAEDLASGQAAGR